MNAPRALPMVSGPVGLADTNSTLTDRSRTGSIRPHVAGVFRIAAIDSSRAWSAIVMFTNPGAATPTEAIGESRTSRPASISAARTEAISRGALRYGRASFIARFVEKSPYSGRAGRSISIATGCSPGSAGNVPLAIARAHAWSIVARTRVLMGVGPVSPADLGWGVADTQPPAHSPGRPIVALRQSRRGPACGTFVPGPRCWGAPPNEGSIRSLVSGWGTLRAERRL